MASVIDFAAPGMDGSAAAAAEGLSGLCFLAGLGLEEDFGKDLTVEQRKALEVLRNEALPAARARSGPAASQRVDEFTLERFLRADKFNPHLAAARLCTTLQWRADNRVDHILAEAPAFLPVYQSLRVRCYPGFDRKGNVIMIERLGEFFGSDCGNTLSIDEWLVGYTHDMATIQGRMRDSSRKHGKPVHKINYIGDLSGLRVTQCLKNLKILKACAQTIEVNFPEQAGQITLVNAPAVMCACWGATKKILDPTVASKVEIHRGIPTQQLLQLIDAEVLPQEFGGNSPCVIPHATTCHRKLAIIHEASRQRLPTVGGVGGPRPAAHAKPSPEADRAGTCGWPSWMSCLVREEDEGVTKPMEWNSPASDEIINTCFLKESTKRVCAEKPQSKTLRSAASSGYVAAGGGCKHFALFAAFSLAALHLALAASLPDAPLAAAL